MNKILLLLVVMLCSITSMAQSTDAMLFGDVKAKEGGQISRLNVMVQDITK